MSSNTLNAVRSFLLAQHMNAFDEWIKGCVEYLTRKIKNLSEVQLLHLVKEQWLLNDLKTICPGSLPGNLKNVPTTMLHGRFILQVNAAEDVGSSSYQQYLKLQRANTENYVATPPYGEELLPYTRMIKLFLTDGVQEVSGIEYRPIPYLNCTITPGTKILIKGPIECRRGIILLTKEGMELIGGEVHELIVTNNYPRLLSSKLGLPMLEFNHDTTNLRPRYTHMPLGQMPPVMANQANAGLQEVNYNNDNIDFAQDEAGDTQFNENPGKRSLNAPSTQARKIPRIESAINYPE